MLILSLCDGWMVGGSEKSFLSQTQLSIVKVRLVILILNNTMHIAHCTMHIALSTLHYAHYTMSIACAHCIAIDCIRKH